MLKGPDETPPTPELAGLELLKLTPTRVSLATVFMAVVGVAGYWQFAGAATLSATGDRVSGSQRAAIADTFGRGRGALVPLAADAERKDWIAALNLPPPAAMRLVRAIDNNERVLGWLTLWDNFDEDGDVVTVSAAGITQTVPISHAPTRVLLAYIPGQPVYVTGERDGGGGVTVAVELTTGPLPLPPLGVGQTIALPLQ